MLLLAFRPTTKAHLLARKKKQAKLQWVVRNIKRKQRMSSENNSSNYYSPLTHLKDAQVADLIVALISFPHGSEDVQI